MAALPDHITITVDEEALRKQIRGIVKSELQVMAFGLRRASNELDPEGWREHEAFLREKWEAETAAVRGEVTTNAE